MCLILLGAINLSRVRNLPTSEEAYLDLIALPFANIMMMASSQNRRFRNCGQ